MTLLSKTLQTLLYKYLSDVDVEGVALPSLYNTDGHSGWGVRLSNVKLREGVKLMDLPGRIPKEPKTEDNAEDQNHATTTTNDVNNHTTSVRTPRRGDSTVPPPPPSAGQSVASWNSSHHRAPLLETVVDDESTIDGEDTEEDEEEDAPRPPLPQRSSSWFSWGAYRSKSEEVSPSSQKNDKDNNNNRLYRSGSEDVSSLQALSVTEHAVLSEPPRSGNFDARLATLEDLENSQNTFASFGEEPTPQAGTTKRKLPQETEREPPMRLRLGKSGSIGILDVRLVGKDLHVVVEDADLTVEAVIVKPSSQNEKEDSSTKEKAPKVKPAKKIPDPQTIGDRILAENKLAKIFSIIPNLFLRDIRIKLILRDEPVDEPEKPTEKESPDDTVIELCIELLSVTDGQDFFAHVREEEDEASMDDLGEYQEAEAAAGNLAPTISPEGQFTQNEYVTKRIRTGRGPEGGMVLKIYPGLKYIDSQVRDPQWARQAWYSSADWCVLRCSGLDAHARIFMGTMKELQIFSAAETWYGDTDFDEYTVDSMLFGGVDYIAPGPQPPLPPMPENAPLDNEEGQLWTLPGATTYRIDANGIQSSFVNSSFHRIARGMLPKPCRHEHLPCEYCDSCWETKPGVPLSHSYDLAAPLGGLVLNLMIRDPLEINVDRPTLQILGVLLLLFKKPDDTKDTENVGSSETTETGQCESSHDPKPLQRSYSLHSKHSQSSYDTANPPLGESNDRSLRRTVSEGGRLPTLASHSDEESDPKPRETDFGDISSAFPSYMSPEKVQYIGIYVNQIIFRAHIMKEDSRSDRAFGFCFWQLLAKCLTIDQQDLSGDITPFKDVRMDCGFLTVTSFKGNEQRLLVSLGVRQRVVEFDEATVDTLMTRGEDCQRPPWPATSTVLLDIPPPIESLVYESRERHAFQIRYIAVHCPDEQKSRSSVHLKLGNANINMPYSSIRDISTVVKEARKAILPEAKKPEAQSATAPEPPSQVPGQRLMKYRIQLEGARVILEPLIDARLPMSTLRGDRSSLSGLFLETVLEKIQLRYGQEHQSTIMDERRVSLERLARLPEQIRMRILLCLDDLNPLARALGMRSEENSFLRCRAINKRIVRVANKKKRRPSLRADEQITRRQFLMQELVKLDDDQLEDLWESHMRRQRRYARSQGNS